MFEVLERGGFLINVMKGNVKDEKLHLEFTIDKKTGAILTGIMGKKGMLDKAFYEHLVLPEKPANNFSIFLFHTGITEMKPKELEQMTSYSVKSLPEGFDYYAGGHVHIRKRFHQALYSEVVYPGPTFPNSFSELEKLNHGSYVFFDSEKLFPLEDDQTKTVHFEFRKIESKKVIKFFVDASDKKENGESSHVCKVPVVLILVIPFPEQSRSGEFRKNLTFRKDQQSPLKRNEVETHIQETVKKILDETFRQKTPHYYPYSLLSACSHQENSKEKKLR